MTRHIRFIAAAALLVASGACRSTTPGTAVEVTTQGGEKVYVAGAVGQGINEDVACRMAVQRSVNSMAEEFAHENDDIGDDVADAVGVKDGKAFLIRFAKHDAQGADIINKKFNPAAHRCDIALRWKPPIFVMEAVQQYAEALKAGELAKTPSAPEVAAASAAPAASAASGSPAAPSTPPPAPSSVAPAARAASAAPTASSYCAGERRALVKSLEGADEAIEDFAECKRRTDGDETICHRYKLHVEDAKKDQVSAGTRFASCLNQGLPADLRTVLRDVAPTHGATVVENLDDGTWVVWAYSPVDKTGYVFQVSQGGTIKDKQALASNQIQWTREKLGLN